MINSQMETETLTLLQANLEAAAGALERGDMVSLRALAEQEARYMDALRAIWSNR